MTKRVHGGYRCPGCRKQAEICVCTGIESGKTTHQLAIIQHPMELWRSSNTVGLVTAHLPSTHLFIRGDPEDEFALRKLVAAPGTRGFMVFPEPGAAEVGAVAASLDPAGPRPLWIILDGSWRQARRMRRRVAALYGIQAVSLSPEYTSGFRVRKQARTNHLSTAEAVALLLGRLDGDTRPHQGLQGVFERWIARLLTFRGLKGTPASQLRPEGRPVQELCDIESALSSEDDKGYNPDVVSPAGGVETEECPS